MQFPRFLTLAAAVILLFSDSAKAQTENMPAAQPDNSIRVSLESAYEAWRRAMDGGDLGLWEQTTAFSRQIETRNRIVSQKLIFPQALFEDPVAAPS